MTDELVENDLRVHKAVTNVLAAVISNPGVRTATKFLRADYTVRATRQQKADRRHKRNTYLVTIGRPNYAERGIAKYLVEGEMEFPMRRVMTSPFPVKRVKKSRR